jgi:CDP-diacylglycerol--serine O-phosphatidyltransferase
MTNTQTDFGAEYDSLADMVAFGLAPALVVYIWALNGLGKFGWLVAFIYTAGTALRLARFNTQVGTTDKRYFQWLASPSAAAIIAGGVWVGVEHGIASTDVVWIAAIITLFSGLLMVSNIRYSSFKEIDFRGKIPFIVLVAVMWGFAIILWHPPLVLFLMFLGYAASGPILTLIQLRQHRAERLSGTGERSDDA